MSFRQGRLDAVTSFTLVEALAGRRSRRFGLGMTIPDGPLAYSSGHEPHPLGADERALLVWAATGLTGWHLGMPHTESGPPEAGCNYPSRLTGRTNPSAAGLHSSELAIIDDSGVYITALRTASNELLEQAAHATSLDSLVALTDSLLMKVTDNRCHLPPAYIAAHNRWNALRPGTTLMVPIADATEQFLGFLSIISGEGAILWDALEDRPVGNTAELLRKGSLNPDARIPLPAFEQLVGQQATVESGIIAYNAQLMLQSMGLGGWLYGGIDANALLGAHQNQGVSGMGFRFKQVPHSPLANPVGLDGYFETLSPPYCSGAEEIVARFIERKFGSGGAYNTSTGTYRHAGAVHSQIQRYDEATIRYFVSVVERLLETYNRVPGTLPTVHTSVYLQAQHVDIDYYEQFHDQNALLDTHREHMSIWHAEAP